MGQKKRNDTGVLVRGLFEVLLDYPQGLPFAAALESSLAKVSQPNNASRCEQLLRGCVAPIKAGWLTVNSNGFVLSAEGRLAYKQHRDPSDFLLAAGNQSVRGWISVHFPASYFFLGKLRDQFASEFRVARRMGIRNLLEKAILTRAP